MSFLNLMRNKLKPKEVNDTLSEISRDVSILESTVNSLAARISEDYSSTVGTKTGQKWIDGKEIYQAVFTGVVPASGEPAVAFYLEYDTIIEIEGTTTNLTTGGIYDADHYLTIQASSQKIRVTGTQYAGNEFMVIVRYTISDPAPEPTNEIKKRTKKSN